MTRQGFTPGDPRARAVGLQGNSAAQQTFAFRRAVKSAELLPAFLKALSDGDWHRGRELSKQLQVGERELRQCADDAAGSVISGNRGYRLLSAATNSEIDHAEARLLSQAKRMTERAAQYRKARNQGGRAA